MREVWKYLGWIHAGRVSFPAGMLLVESILLQPPKIDESYLHNLYLWLNGDSSLPRTEVKFPINWRIVPKTSKIPKYLLHLSRTRQTPTRLQLQIKSPKALHQVF